MWQAGGPVIASIEARHPETSAGVRRGRGLLSWALAAAILLLASCASPAAPAETRPASGRGPPPPARGPGPAPPPRPPPPPLLRRGSPSAFPIPPRARRRA